MRSGIGFDRRDVLVLSLMMALLAVSPLSAQSADSRDGQAEAEALEHQLREMFRDGCPDAPQVGIPQTPALPEPWLAGNGQPPRLSNRQALGAALEALYRGAPRQRCPPGLTTVVDIEVGANGRVLGSVIRKTSGSGQLDSAIVEALAMVARFTPAVVDGVPVPATIRVPLTVRR